MATTASTKPERKTSLRSGISATPFSVRSPPFLLAHQPLVARVDRIEVDAGGRSGVRHFHSSAEDGNRPIEPYALFFGLVRGFLNWA